MNNDFHKTNGKRLFSGILFFVAAALFLLAPHAAVNVDEQLHYPHAKNVVNWYFTGGKDQSCLHTPQTNLKYYGQSVDNFTALFNRVWNIENEFLVRHYTGAFFFLLLLLFSGLLTREVTGSWMASGIVVMALVFMPRLAGQAFGNLKDIPFAAGYVAGLLMIVRFLKEFPVLRWKTVLLLGLAIAFTISVRAGGFILFAYLGLVLMIYFILKPYYFKQIITTRPVFVRLLAQGAAILVIGYFAGLLFWPYALQNILIHPVESLRVMEHYKVSIRQVFEGELMWSTQLPWYYLPKWLLISSPLIPLIGFILFIGYYFKKIFFSQSIDRQILLEGFILFSFIFPLVYVMIIDSNLYSGIRQMLFILPSMTILSVWGVFTLLGHLAKRIRFIYYFVMVVFAAGLLWPLKHQATTFPVDYVYFNLLAGGNKKAWSNYEYDYYFHGVKQAVDYLVKLPGNNEFVVGMNSNLSSYIENRPGMKYTYTRFLERSSADWDYGIFGLNYLEPQILKKDLWIPSDVIKTFYHKGNPVAVLVKRPDKSDFYGISEIKNGNLYRGIEFLEAAVKKQNNNVWLYVNLAKAKLEIGRASCRVRV